MTVVTRFAPSPTGDLHLGHVYSASFARDRALGCGGRFLIRIEDIDRGRCRAEFVARNLEDLAWLGLTWEEPVLRQSGRMEAYRAALCRLDDLGVVYPCFCTRRQIRDEIARAGGAPHADAADAGALYPGTCRRLDPAQRADRQAGGEPYALRLDARAAASLTGPLTWIDLAAGTRPVDLSRHGDVVIARKDIPTSYHVAVVVDDAAQGVSEVTRGEDLLDSTPVHRLLYCLLGLPVPVWHHHRLCRDAAGRRLAKRDGDTSVRALRRQGLSPASVLALATRAADAAGSNVPSAGGHDGDFGTGSGVLAADGSGRCTPVPSSGGGSGRRSLNSSITVRSHSGTPDR
ncbi:MAG: tRNA glutamyl-Q(34) synthetase GluQRS [Rhodospirillales bacterium]|nr:MAG: tRNA glutamyl-Q(34) synthetase GluQRS [Rhodospirillales bacterium]